MQKELNNAKTKATENPKQGIDELENVISKAEKTHNIYYKMLAYCDKTFFYTDLNDFKNVLKSADSTIILAQKLSAYEKEIEATVKKSWALMHLGLINEAEAQLKNSYPLLSKLNTNSDYHLAIIGNYWNTYHEFYNVQAKDADAIKKGLKALEYYSKIKDREDRNRRLIQSYTSLGSSYLFEKKVDSALHYFQTANNLFSYNKYKDKKALAIIYSGSGMAYNMRREYQKALQFLLQGLKISKDNYPDIYTETLNQLNINFKATNNNTADNPYYKEFLRIKNENEKKNKLTSEEIQEIKDNNNSNLPTIKIIQLFIISFIIILSLIIYIGINKYNKQKEQSKNIVDEKSSHDFNEIIKLAKTNDSAFITRFQEIYPNFYVTLTKQYPLLTATHIKILSYSYLNYTTKDIAVFMSVSVRTVQTHKYRIRKIINISSEQDIIEWTKQI
ncbi:LuxR C-terminal-related transcriptional regulator [Chryseobacterium sp. G0186]|uniref:LuxR C-terminal-related transcriptional regulator n=1 Tax=Chryseobacterium sp. G0186 TaxID=2487064 RepID=UPI0013DE45B1|nr:LuxR C-terminal-related transcriptional regulator [Chryseobacterium sp. G0186]